MIKYKRANVILFELFSKFTKLSALVLCVCMLSHFSHVWLFVILLTIAYKSPLSVGFSRQEYWSGLLFPSPGDLPDPGIEPGSPALQADCLWSEPQGSPSVNYAILNICKLLKDEILKVTKTEVCNCVRWWVLHVICTNVDGPRDCPAEWS